MFLYKVRVTVTETATGGTDTVQTSVSLTFGAHLENLTLTGLTAINGTGTTLSNLITGNGAANILNGGGAGNDIYVSDCGGPLCHTGHRARTDQCGYSDHLSLLPP